ncbi:MAG: hypothetical protein J6X18_04860 [Bacteroidales bacterium]|nr:hypothetical protein [Bacteroidales bacterium]
MVAEESASYAIVRFPKEWIMPDKAAIKENFKVEIVYQDGYIYFVTEIINGSECIFDAIDYVISFNKQLSATKELFDQKKEELKKLFMAEPLERLKNLRFVIDPVKKTPKRAQKPKVQEEKPAVQEPKQENEEQKAEPEIEAPSEPDNSLMSFAKSVTE